MRQTRTLSSLVTARLFKAVIGGALACAVALAAPAVAAPPTPGVGINIYALTSASTQIPFTDVFKMSAPWIIRSLSDTSYKGVPTLTKDGWIASLNSGQYAFTQIMNSGDGHIPGGVYTVFYTGKGTLDFRWRGVEVLSQSDGQAKLRVTPETAINGIAIKIMATDPADPIRDIRVILPGYESSYTTQVFNPAFLATLKPFKVLRMMAWNRTNRADTVEWADRRPPTYATQASDLGNAQQPMTGVAYEYQIDLANTLGADPWVNAPVKASDDFIYNMARLFKARLKPGLRPHIEFSNEVWNTYFADGRYAQDQGMAQGLAGDARTAGLYWYVQRAERMFEIWDEVYGADAASKVVHIMGGVYEGSPQVGETVLGYGAVPHREDALAVGSYFASAALNAKSYQSFLDVTPQQAIDLMRQDAQTRVKDWTAQHMDVARRHNVALVVYEGGPGLEASTIPKDVRQPIVDAYTAANRSPELAAVYKDVLDNFFATGGQLFMHFNDVFQASQFGNFGALEYQNQDPATSPKYMMLKSYAETQASQMRKR